MILTILGSRCQHVNECKEKKDLCGANGYCDTIQNGTAYCVCNGGYTGTFCEIEINECNDTVNPCDSVRSTCVNTPGHYMCVCKDGYTG